MEYQVPQFTEIEDKIIGPLTLRQFIYLAGAGGLCIVFFSYLPFIVALLFSVPVVALAGTLSFYKINGKPFIEVLEAGFNYYVRAKLFLWKHQTKPDLRQAGSQDDAGHSSLRETKSTPKLTRGKLSELAWSLDVKTMGGELANREK